MLTEAPSLLEELTERKVQHFTVSSRWLRETTFRLDAGFYADEALAARRLIEESGYEFKPLEQLTSEIFNLSRFKRIYTSDPKQGWPYLSASDVLLFRPQAPRCARRHFVKEGWILVSCSGSVGRCVLATRRLEPYFLTHDLIRIVPSILNGYLYAFLSSWLGQALLQKDQYGSTVQHLEPHHVEAVPIPLLPEEQQRWIHERVIEAYKLRDEANDLLDKAEELLYSELGLPRFDESRVPYLGGSKPKAFTLRASELEGRFDASFHVPIAKAAIEQMKQGKYPLVRLGEVAERIFIPPRFKRIYVSSGHGIPLLQGSHIPQMKPFDLKFISQRMTTKLEQWIIHSKWVLVTCSGTIGRVALCPTAWDSWAASQHILRIMANPQKSHPGYLAAFLMTPYGQHQLTSKIYGGVVDELTEDDTANVYLPNPPLEVQEAIGALVIEAFEKKEQANAIEDQAIRRLEEALKRGKQKG
jgi:type I restriction enzyme S subunit